MHTQIDIIYVFLKNIVNIKLSFIILILMQIFNSISHPYYSKVNVNNLVLCTPIKDNALY